MSVCEAPHTPGSDAGGGFSVVSALPSHRLIAAGDTIHASPPSGGTHTSLSTSAVAVACAVHEWPSQSAIVIPPTAIAESGARTNTDVRSSPAYVIDVHMWAGHAA